MITVEELLQKAQRAKSLHEEIQRLSSINLLRCKAALEDLSTAAEKLPNHELQYVIERGIAGVKQQREDELNEILYELSQQES